MDDIKFKIISNDNIIDSLTVKTIEGPGIAEIYSESQRVEATLKDLSENTLSHNSDITIYTNS